MYEFCLFVPEEQCRLLNW